VPSALPALSRTHIYLLSHTQANSCSFPPLPCTHPDVPSPTFFIYPHHLHNPQRQYTTNMSAQPITQKNTSAPSSTKNDPSKQVATIAVYVSTTVHTVTEPWSPDVPTETRSGKSPSLTQETHSLTHVLPTVHIYAEHPSPHRVSVDEPETEEGHITVSRVGVND